MQLLTYKCIEWAQPDLIPGRPTLNLPILLLLNVVMPCITPLMQFLTYKCIEWAQPDLIPGRPTLNLPILLFAVFMTTEDQCKSSRRNVPWCKPGDHLNLLTQHKPRRRSFIAHS